jgi:uroporphyrinogen decarboxylase
MQQRICIVRDIPVKNPKPDFENLVNVLTGSKEGDRVLSAELLIDEEIKKTILEDYLDETYYPPPVSQWGTDKVDSSDREEKKKYYEKYYRQSIRFWYLMGYSLYSDLTFTTNFESLNTLVKKTEDTAALSKGVRHWAVEGNGVIRSWQDFELFPWKRAEELIDEYTGLLGSIEKFLPDGMKIGAVATHFEEPLEWIFGYEGFFYLMSDQPDLVEAVFDKVGKVMYDFYDAALQFESVGYIFHADDLGYKTATLISPEDLGRLVFPWMKKYVDVAHRRGKPFFLHSCGNRDRIMDTLVDEVGIDAIHSFEDVSYPVTRYKEQWGDRVGIIGGVDVDKLARYDEKSLRDYVRGILEICTRGGRYVFGSGNSIANYIPVENYLIMLDEGLKWR